MKNTTCHAVLSNGVLTTLEREGTQWGVSHPLLTLPITLASLCSLAVEKGFTHLWVYPDKAITPDAQFFKNAEPFYDLFASWVYPVDFPLEEGVTNELVSVTGFKRPKGGQKQVTIIFPMNTAWAWIDEQTTPKMLLQVIKYLEAQLQVPISGGATSTGMKYLQECNFFQEDDLEKPTVDLSSLPFHEGAQDIIWQQGDTRNLQRGWFLHKLDKNSAYLRSCVEEYMGVGNPRYVSGDAYRDNHPGVWHCRVDGIANARLPHPSWYPYDAYLHWFASPMIKCLRKLGYTVEIYEGYTYEEKQRPLKKWAQYLWDIRSSFRNDSEKWKHPVAREKAREAIKDIYTSTLGLINSDIVKGTWKYRPDWHVQILAGVRATMFYNMTKFAESGYYPQIVYMDALFYLTPHQDIEQDIPGVLAHQTSLGGYKHEYTLLIDEQIEQVLKASLPLNQKIKTLNTLGAK